jgi:multidrug efflux pump
MVLSVLAVILLVGLGSYISIPKEGDPEAQIPFVFVNVMHIGISPEDAERLLGRPLENELNDIEGIREMKMIAGEGFLTVVLEFPSGDDVDQAILDVREKVDRAKSEFPDDTEEPMVTEFNTSEQPVIRVNIHGDVSEHQLYRLARRLKDRVEGIPQVLEAQMYGFREEVLEIVIDQTRMESYGVGAFELIRIFTMNNRLIAAGSLDTGQGRFQVKVPGLIETRQDILEIPVISTRDGVIKVGDIADVRRTFSDVQSFARLNGVPGIGMGVAKRSGENIIETVQAIRHVVAEMTEQKDWPQAAHVVFTDDRSDEIYEILTDLQANVTTAVILVMIIIVMTLGVRSAALVGIAIPSSFLFAFLILNLTGQTVNMMVMFALVVAVGMLVDGAIVVIEYADRKINQGFERSVAYGAAATRMFWPIMSSTATTLAAFLPLLLWPGMTGSYMFFLPVTLILTLSGSLLTAIWFLPALGSVFGRSGEGSTDIEKALDPIADSAFDDQLEKSRAMEAYEVLLQWTVQRPVRVLVSAFALLIAVFYLYGVFQHGVILVSQEEASGAQIVVSARGNLSIDEINNIVGAVEHIVLDTEGVETVFANASSAANTDPFMSLPRDAVGELFIEFVDWQGRRPVVNIFAEIRERVGTLAGVVIEINPFQKGFGGGKDVNLELRSRDRALLPIAAAQVKEHLRANVEGLIDIDDTDQLPGIQWELRVDRAQAKKFGADVTLVGFVVQLVTNGIKIGEYRPDDAEDELDIRLRFPEAERGLGTLDNLKIRTSEGLVPISNFVTRRPKQSVNALEKIDGQWTLAVRANTVPGVLPNDKVQEIRAWLEGGSALDSGVTFRFGGDDRLQAESAGFLGYAFLGALLLMGAILLTQFNSYYHSLLILSSVVMSTSGVLLGMLATGQPFSMILTGTGIIALAGIVVNNNIVLIDTYQRLRASGVDPIEAVVKTGVQRLRPIMLTTVTTIVGLMPMVLQISVDIYQLDISIGSPTSYFWKPLSTAIVAGLGFSTFLTLIVTPAALALPVHLKRWVRNAQNQSLNQTPDDSAVAPPGE